MLKQSQVYYNLQHGIVFKFSPLMQCILGKFEGWMIVLEVFNSSMIYDQQELKDKEIKFTYSKPSQFKKLFKYIQKSLKKTS